MKIRLSKPKLLAGALLWHLALPVQAMPDLKDHWRFFCAPFGYNKKVMGRAKAQSQAGGLKGAIGTFQFACVQSALEVKQYEDRLEKFRAQGGAGKPPQLNTAQSDAMWRQASERLSAAYENQTSNAEAVD